MTLNLPTMDDLRVVDALADLYMETHTGPSANDKGFIAPEVRKPRLKWAMLRGILAGIDPLHAVDAYYVVSYDGGKTLRVDPAPDERLRLITEHPDYDWKAGLSNAETCTFQFRKRDVSGGWHEWQDYTLTRAQADEMNLTKRNTPGWSANPKGFLRAKCIKYGMKLYCPDVIGFDAEADGEMDAFMSDFPAHKPEPFVAVESMGVTNAEEERLAEEESWTPDETRPATQVQPSDYENRIVNLRDPKFNLASQAVESYVNAIVQATGRADPGELWRSQFARKSHDDQKLALLELAGQAPAVAPEASSDDNYIRLMAKLQDADFAVPEARLPNAVATIALKHGKADAMPGEEWMNWLKGLPRPSQNETLISYDRDGAQTGGN